MNTSRRKTPRALLAALILATLGGVSYLLADRYLIEHVEIEDVSAYAGAVSQTSSAPAATAISPSLSALVQDTGAEQNAASVADDWNYRSDGVSISIRGVTTGSGADAVTYFVADVVLAGAQLDSAFAKDKFGANIIEYTSTIAENHAAIFAINGDYYGFRDDGIIIRNGVVYRDVPARTGLAFYRDGSMKIYDETRTGAQQLLDQGVWNTLSFGPALIEAGQVVENLGRVTVDNNLGNHSIQGNNPRTGVGMIARNHFVFVVVDGRSPGYSRGMSLDEFAQVFADLGCTEAYNIDGGGSSTMYFMGRVVNNPLGRNKERGTSDILYIGS